MFETLGDGLAELLPGPELLLDALEGKHVPVHRSPQGEDQAGDAGEGQGGPEARKEPQDKNGGVDEAQGSHQT